MAQSAAVAHVVAPLSGLGAPFFRNDVKLSDDHKKELEEASKPAWDYPYDFIERIQRW